MELARSFSRGRHSTLVGTGLAILVALAGACGDDGPSGPTLDINLVAGTYNLTVLTFDPQGILPQNDIRATLGTAPQLILNTSGAAQIVYQDPATNLFTTIAATYRTTADGIRLDFASNSPYASLLLSRRMDFTFSSSPKTLTFEGEAPDGVSRARLIQLVPQLANEQLLDPVPGVLRVIFAG